MHNKHLEELLRIIHIGQNNKLLPEIIRINNIDEGKKQFYDNIEDLILVSLALSRDKMLEVLLDYCEPNFFYNMLDTVYLLNRNKNVKQVFHTRDPHVNGRYAICLC